MIIGSNFSEKNRKFLQKVASLSNNDVHQKISVKKINETLDLDRTEIKNMLEHLEDLGYLDIKTIGGPFLYGHVCITEQGIKKASE